MALDPRAAQQEIDRLKQAGLYSQAVSLQRQLEEQLARESMSPTPPPPPSKTLTTTPTTTGESTPAPEETKEPETYKGLKIGTERYGQRWTTEGWVPIGPESAVQFPKVPGELVPGGGTLSEKGIISAVSGRAGAGLETGGDYQPGEAWRQPSISAEAERLRRQGKTRQAIELEAQAAGVTTASYTKAIQERQAWESQHVKLGTNEWVTLEDFNSLGAGAQAALMKYGTKGLEDYYTRTSAATEADVRRQFGDEYIQLGDGQWISREDYSSLTPIEKKIADTQGLQALMVRRSIAMKATIAGQYSSASKAQQYFLSNISDAREGDGYDLVKALMLGAPRDDLVSIGGFPRDEVDEAWRRYQEYLSQGAQYEQQKLLRQIEIGKIPWYQQQMEEYSTALQQWERDWNLYISDIERTQNWQRLVDNVPGFLDENGYPRWDVALAAGAPVSVLRKAGASDYEIKRVQGYPVPILHTGRIGPPGGGIPGVTAFPMGLVLPTAKDLREYGDRVGYYRSPSAATHMTYIPERVPEVYRLNGGLYEILPSGEVTLSTIPSTGTYTMTPTSQGPWETMKRMTSLQTLKELTPVYGSVLQARRAAAPGLTPSERNVERGLLYLSIAGDIAMLLPLAGFALKGASWVAKAPVLRGTARWAGGEAIRTGAWAGRGALRYSGLGYLGAKGQQVAIAGTKGLKELWTPIKEGVGELSSEFKVGLRELTTPIGELWVPVRYGLRDLRVASMEGLSGLASPIRAFSSKGRVTIAELQRSASELRTGFGVGIRSMWVPTIEGWRDLVNESRAIVRSGVRDLWTPVQASWSEFSKSVKLGVEELSSGVKGGVKELWTPAREGLRDLVSRTDKYFRTGMRDILTPLQQGYSTIDWGFGAGIQTLFSPVKDYWVPLHTGTREFFGAAKGGVSELWNPVVSGLRDFRTGFYEGTAALSKMPSILFSQAGSTTSGWFGRWEPDWFKESMRRLRMEIAAARYRRAEPPDELWFMRWSDEGPGGGGGAPTITKTGLTLKQKPYTIEQLMRMGYSREQATRLARVLLAGTLVSAGGDVLSASIGRMTREAARRLRESVAGQQFTWAVSPSRTPSPFTGGSPYPTPNYPSPYRQPSVHGYPGTYPFPPPEYAPVPPTETPPPTPEVKVISYPTPVPPTTVVEPSLGRSIQPVVMPNLYTAFSTSVEPVMPPSYELVPREVVSEDEEGKTRKVWMPMFNPFELDLAKLRRGALGMESSTVGLWQTRGMGVYGPHPITGKVVGGVVGKKRIRYGSTPPRARRTRREKVMPTSLRMNI